MQKDPTAARRSRPFCLRHCIRSRAYRASDILSDPTEFRIVIFCTVLALAAASVAALIPGLLHIQTPWLRAGSALAVFMLIFKFSPKSLVAPVMTEFRGVNTYWKVLECHDRTAL
jgi:hypothetical protein